jgi:hypothetical protein
MNKERAHNVIDIDRENGSKQQRSDNDMTTSLNSPVLIKSITMFLPGGAM